MSSPRRANRRRSLPVWHPPVLYVVGMSSRALFARMNKIAPQPLGVGYLAPGDRATAPFQRKLG